MPLDLIRIRQQFPTLDQAAVFFDNPGGTQISRQSLNRINAYLLECNANHGGAFATSEQSDALLHEAHAAAADLLNASSPEEIVFGANMTTLTFHISRSLARTWQAGDEIVVTRLDHDANITPWVMAAEDRGCHVCWVDFNPSDGTLDLEGLQAALERKPRLLAVGYASNSLGTINPVKRIVQMAHQAGTQVYIDAVQYAAHGPIDVQDLDCDFLVCSAYKYFGPHVGVLYGKYEHLEALTAYKVRPSPKLPPGKFETGTLNHEGIAGVLGAIEYLEWVGKNFGEDYLEKYGERFTGRKLRLKQALASIRAYEYEISRQLLDILEEIPGITLYGLKDVRKLEQRVPTFAFNLRGRHPRQVAEVLGKHGIYVWDGNYYALAITQRLGVEETGGMVRVGPVHYNTLEEVEKFGKALREIAASSK